MVLTRLASLCLNSSRDTPEGVVGRRQGYLRVHLPSELPQHACRTSGVREGANSEAIVRERHTSGRDLDQRRMAFSPAGTGAAAGVREA